MLTSLYRRFISLITSISDFLKKGTLIDPRAEKSFQLLNTKLMRTSMPTLPDLMRYLKLTVMPQILALSNP